MYICVAMGFFFFAYGILMLQTYGNSMSRRCVKVGTDILLVPERFCKDVGSLDECPGDNLCVKYGNPEEGFRSFDHIGVALLSLFQIHTLDNYVGRYLNPMLESEPVFSYITWIITTSTILFVSLIIINLFVAVIVDTYMNVREQDEQIRKEAEHLRKAVDLQMLGEIPDIMNTNELSRNIRARLQNFVEQPSFEWGVSVVIICNSALFLITYEDMPDKLTNSLDLLQFTFACMHAPRPPQCIVTPPWQVCCRDHCAHSGCGSAVLHLVLQPHRLSRRRPRTLRRHLEEVQHPVHSLASP